MRIFCPLNLTFIPQEVKQYMAQNSNYIYIIDYSIQTLVSGYCGFFCILVILFAVNQIHLFEGLSVFRNLFLQNDNKMYRRFGKMVLDILLRIGKSIMTKNNLFG